MKGDEEGEFTYTGGRGDTVIDYVIGEEEVRERISKLEVGERIDSDHHPIVITVEGGERERRKRKRGIRESGGEVEWRREEKL